VSFSLFGLEIYYYGVIITAGILAAFICGLIIFKKIGYKEELAYLILLICVPLGIIGARLYYVIFSDWSMYETFFDVINIRSGGIAIYGGVIGGALGLFIVSRIKKCGFFTLADIGVICLILAQSIGRWGNFTNAEVYGFAVDTHIFPFTVNVDGQAHLATFFYESILNLAGFVFLLFIFFKVQRKNKEQPIDRNKKLTPLRGGVPRKAGRGGSLWGITSACYLIWYGTVRAILEPLREPEYILHIIGNNNIVFNQVSFVISLVTIALGVILLFAVKKGWISQENKQCLTTNTTETENAK